MHAINVKTLENLYKGGKYDDLHTLMGSNTEQSDAISPAMRVWYGRLLETLGDDAAADEQYAMAGRTGAIDRIRSVLRQGCSVREAIRIVTDTGYPEACGFLARFLDSTFPNDDTLHEDILVLYCKGECVDYACEYAIMRGKLAIQKLLGRLGEKRFVTPVKKLKALLSYFEIEENIICIIRVLSASTDGVLRALQLCISHNLREDLSRMLSDSDILDRLKVDLMSSGNIKEHIEPIAASIQDPQLRFNLYLKIGTEFRGEILDMYVAHDTAKEQFRRLERYPERIRMDESSLDCLCQQADHWECRESLKIMALYAEKWKMYALSCKLWTKAGDPSRAIRVLIEEGNAEAVASYAISTIDTSAKVSAIRFLQTRSSLSIYSRTIFDELTQQLSTEA